MQRKLLVKIRLWIALFVIGLVLSGITAFPLVHELRLLESALGTGSAVGARWPALGHWISLVHAALEDTAGKYPFLAYGTDWLAFAHLVIAAAFWGPYVDPVRNRWIIRWGMLACGGILPLALICAPVRHIPWFWTLIDCSFAVFGILPLLYVERLIGKLEKTGGAP